MTTTLLRGGLKATIGMALTGLFRDATLERDGTSTSNSPDVDAADWAPIVTGTTQYTCKAIYESYSNYSHANNLVDINDRKVLVLASTLSTTPIPGDRVIIDSLTFDVEQVDTDPANAVWQLKAKVGIP